MKGTIISPESEFYTVKDIDAFIEVFSKEVPLKDLIENMEVSLQVHDALEQLVTEGKLEKGGQSDEDTLFEEVRKTIRILKKKIKTQSLPNKESRGKEQ